MTGSSANQPRWVVSLPIPWLTEAEIDFLAVNGPADQAIRNAADTWGVRVRQAATEEPGALSTLTLSILERSVRPQHPPVLQRRKRGGVDRIWCSGSVLTLSPDGKDTLEYAPPSTGSSTAPLSLLMSVAFCHALSRVGIPAFHGSAFTVNDRSVLAVGPSGTGKSTLAAVAIRLGGQVVSDDALLAVPVDGGSPRLLPSRTFLGFREQSVSLLPDTVGGQLHQFRDPSEDRWILWRPRNSDLFLKWCTPDALWSVSVDRRLAKTRIEAATQGEALAALICATSPLYLSSAFPDARRLQLPVLMAIAQGARASTIRLGRDLMDDPQGVLEHLLTVAGA